MAIFRSIWYKVHERDIDIMREVSNDLAEYVRQNEPGTLLYTTLQDNDDPGAFMHVMSFASREAEKIHRSSQMSSKFVNTLYPIMVKGMIMKDYYDVNIVINSRDKVTA